MDINLGGMSYRELVDLRENVNRAIEKSVFQSGYREAKKHGRLIKKKNELKKNQKLREKIIEEAKEDVKQLLERNKKLKTFDVSFNVHSSKDILHRWSVIATAKSCVTNREFIEAAVCADGECFNIHIGKAIALRRVLGLEVKGVYLNVPQPTEVRVGDTILTGGHVEKVIGFEEDGSVMVETGCLMNFDHLDPDNGDRILADSDAENTFFYGM
ncbi:MULTISPECIES: hypothetical protein [Bacillus amyloliquefaciens group]|uniref:hypothetical protein n=1 Tax=Bacillus amyloliquefaciens group TaxID=1938374 RepID=UPI00073B2060|nr:MULTISPECIES: hypothetical protein [Bacillus amyloliquefaciens group]KTF59864.1 hypothetical protein AR691_14130 [Bacillus amyloliquefaciens]